MSQTDDVVKQMLDYFEPRINLPHVHGFAARHRAILDYEAVDRLPLIIYVPYEGEDFVPYPYVEAFADPAKMLVNELLQNSRTSIYHQVRLKDDAPYCLRPNLGVTIIASMFGAEVQLMEDAMPWVLPFEGRTPIRSIANSPLPDLQSGLLPRVLDQYAYFHEALADYPNCRAAFQITMPDLQGPFNTAELLMGSDIYLAFYDDEGRNLISGLLARITEAMLVVYERLKREDTNAWGMDYQYQHTAGQKGRIMVRNDSVSNMSPDHYRELVEPFDMRLASEVGCIGFHACGRIERHFQNWSKIAGMCCLDVGQPELNDLDAMYATALARRIPLTRLVVPEEQLKAHRMLERFPTGVSLLHKAQTVAEAYRVWERYCDHG